MSDTVNKNRIIQTKWHVASQGDYPFEWQHGRVLSQESARIIKAYFAGFHINSAARRILILDAPHVFGLEDATTRRRTLNDRPIRFQYCVEGPPAMPIDKSMFQLVHADEAGEVGWVAAHGSNANSVALAGFYNFCGDRSVEDVVRFLYAPGIEPSYAAGPVLIVSKGTIHWPNTNTVFYTNSGPITVDSPTFSVPFKAPGFLSRLNSFGVPGHSYTNSIRWLGYHVITPPVPSFTYNTTTRIGTLTGKYGCLRRISGDLWLGRLSQTTGSRGTGAAPDYLCSPATNYNHHDETLGVMFNANLDMEDDKWVLDLTVTALHYNQPALDVVNNGIFDIVHTRVTDTAFQDVVLPESGVSYYELSLFSGDLTVRIDYTVSTVGDVTLTIKILHNKTIVTSGTGWYLPTAHHRMSAGS